MERVWPVPSSKPVLNQHRLCHLQLHVALGTQGQARSCMGGEAVPVHPTLVPVKPEHAGLWLPPAHAACPACRELPAGRATSEHLGGAGPVRAETHRNHPHPSAHLCEAEISAQVPPLPRASCSEVVLRHHSKGFLAGLDPGKGLSLAGHQAAIPWVLPPAPAGPWRGVEALQGGWWHKAAATRRDALLLAGARFWYPGVWGGWVAMGFAVGFAGWLAGLVVGLAEGFGGCWRQAWVCHGQHHYGKLHPALLPALGRGDGVQGGRALGTLRWHGWDLRTCCPALGLQWPPQHPSQGGGNPALPGAGCCSGKAPAAPAQAARWPGAGQGSQRRQVAGRWQAGGTDGMAWWGDTLCCASLLHLRCGANSGGASSLCPIAPPVPHSLPLHPNSCLLQHGRDEGVP